MTVIQKDFAVAKGYFEFAESYTMKLGAILDKG